MKNWNDYKNTYRTESDLFDFARQGDLRGLANLLAEQPEPDFNAKNNRGYSALMLAVYNSKKDFCEALLRCGADVNSTDSVGNTLLMGAAFKGDLNIIRLLLGFGAEVKLKNKTNMTVRDWALMFKRNEVINYLDSHYPTQEPSSKIKNIFRFIKLSLLLMQTKMKKGTQ